jgi:hypothetical protein
MRGLSHLKSSHDCGVFMLTSLLHAAMDGTLEFTKVLIMMMMILPIQTETFLSG